MDTSMKKAVFIIILILVLCLALTACNGKEEYKETKTIDIKTIDDLKLLHNYLGDHYSLYKYELKNDLDLAGQDWKPIGYDNENSFRGTFNGNGHTISNLTIKGFDKFEFQKSIPYKYTGLFGYVYDATINNIKLENINISYFAENDYTHTGGLIGYAYGKNNISNIDVSGQINLGTSFYYIQKEVLDLTCKQNQYIGGIIGYASGKITLKNSKSDITINNLIASRGPQIDYMTDSIVYEKNDKGENTDKPIMDVIFDKTDPARYTQQAFAGSIAGYIRGNGALIDEVSGKANVSTLYSRSAYLGGLFGAVYKTHIANSSFSGNLETRVYAKGVSGGIAGLIDESRISNCNVLSSEIKLSVTKSEYQSYTSGGIAGYANDFSIIQNSKVASTKILSNLLNITINNESINYPVIGGLVGTLRNSEVVDCIAEGGGVFRTNYTDIDDKYIYSAGMVADVYGNSSVKRCQSSFKAYTGAIAKYTECIYVEENGKRILRYIKEGFPNVYVGIDAYVKDNVLFVDIIDESRDIIATYTYNEFSGSGIEEYSTNYYNENLGCLVDEKGDILVINGRSFEGYERLTGIYSFEQLDYLAESMIYISASDEVIEEGWKRFVL